MTRAVRILRPGLLTTVQDLGRWGAQASGVPVAGPMDEYSHRLANALVSNDPAAATLEITLVGPELEFVGSATCALCGGVFEATLDGTAIPLHASVEVHSGARLRIDGSQRGARAYLSVDGGFQTTPVLGSRATHLLSRMGGVAGRALVENDTLPLTPQHRPVAPVRADPLTSLSEHTRLRVVAGPQWDAFEDGARTMLTAAPYRVSQQSDRMGYRLEGPALPRHSTAEPISEPLAMGALQVPAAGQPILLMADRQTAGGYPKIASVIAADLPLAGQLAPGDRLTFTLCSRQDAIKALLACERRFLRAVRTHPPHA